MCCLIEREKRGGGREKKRMIKKRMLDPRFELSLPAWSNYIITTILRGLEVCSRRPGLYLSVYVVFFDKLDSNRQIVGEEEECQAVDNRPSVLTRNVVPPYSVERLNWLEIVCDLCE